MQKKKGPSLALGVLVFLCPFAYYYKAVIPGCSFSLAITNDFIPLYYTYKVYLLDLLAHGHFPLWSPAEASGYPFYSNPFTQAFYPLNLPLVLYYKIAGGYSVFDHQAFSVLGVSIFALGLYLWLNLLTTNRRAAFFSAVLISLSFKLGEILRFPNAVHAAAWLPWILLGMTQTAAKGQHIRGGVTVFASSLMLLTSGYPYYAYYSLFLFPPYALLLIFRGSRRLFLEAPSVESFHRRKFLFAMLLSVGSALALCAPYWVKTQQLLQQTANRTGSNYGYATFRSFNFQDSLGSLLFPPAAQAEGWFYFSMLGLFLLVVFFAAPLLGRALPRSEKGLIFIGVLWIGLISAVTYGKHSFIFDFLWRFMPGFSSLRMWGRMNIILLPILALLLMRAYGFFETLLRSPHSNRHLQHTRSVSVLILLTATAVVVATVQVWFYLGASYHSYWLVHFTYAHGREWIFMVSTILAFVLLSLVFALSLKRPLVSSRSLALLLAGLLFFALNDMHPVGSSQWMKKARKTYGSERRVLGFHEIIEKSLIAPRIRLYYTMTFPHFNVGWVYSWYFQRYLAFDQKLFPVVRDMIGEEGLLHYGTPLRIRPSSEFGSPRAYAEFMGMRSPKRIFLTRRIDHTSIEDFLSDANLTESTLVQEMRVTRYDGDTLNVSIRHVEPLYLSFTDNWDPDWRALVNGDPKPVQKLFGTFKAVRIRPGNNRVTLVYRPFF
jgi:hypothetical protein